MVLLCQAVGSTHAAPAPQSTPCWGPHTSGCPHSQSADPWKDHVPDTEEGELTSFERPHSFQSPPTMRPTVLHQPQLSSATQGGSEELPAGYIMYQLRILIETVRNTPGTGLARRRILSLVSAGLQGEGNHQTAPSPSLGLCLCSSQCDITLSRRSSAASATGSTTKRELFPKCPSEDTQRQTCVPASQSRVGVSPSLATQERRAGWRCGRRICQKRRGTFFRRWWKDSRQTK